MTNIPEVMRLVQNRHTTFIEYNEPREGLSVDGNRLDCHTTVSMSVHDAINLHRKATENREQKLSDCGLLDDFMIIHYAWVKK